MTPISIFHVSLVIPSCFQVTNPFSACDPSVVPTVFAPAMCLVNLLLILHLV